jgi:hypothetical protein
MTRIVFILVLCFCCPCGHAQNVSDSAYHEMLRLQSEGVDTLLTYSKWGMGYFTPETSQKFGKISVDESFFVFYQKRGQAFVERCMSFGDSSGHYGYYAISKPLMVDANEVLNWVARDAEKISGQPIANYVFKQKTEGTSTVFEVYRPENPIRYLSWIYIKEDKPGVSFCMDYVERKYSEQAPENLNYSYNIWNPWLQAVFAT